MCYHEQQGKLMTHVAALNGFCHALHTAYVLARARNGDADAAQSHRGGQSADGTFAIASDL